MTKFENWNELLKTNSLLSKGVEVLNILNEHGTAYIVGGAVRDLLTNEKNPNDIDIATDVSMEITSSLFNTHDIGKNKEFGIVVINFKGEDFEVAMFRKDGEYSNGRHPDYVEVGVTFEEDSSRRDFTINSMGVDVDGNIIDYHNGQTDIENKVIRTVGNPLKRFEEDHLRMLRAVRFSSRLGMAIETNTFNAIKDNSNKITSVSNERITKELFKMAEQTGSKFAESILTLKDCGLLTHILPEIETLDNMPQDKEHHPEGDVLTHVMEALRSNTSTDPVLNLSILLHDVGKGITYEFKNNKNTYHGHESKGVELLDVISDRLKFDNKTSESIKFASVNHMKFHKILDMKPSKVKKLIDNDNWDMLKNVSLADAKSRGHLFSQTHWNNVMACVDNISDKFGKTDVDPCKAVVNGKLVMELRNITKPGKEIGIVINDTIEWIVNNNISLDSINSIKEHIKNVKV